MVVVVVTTPVMKDQCCAANNCTNEFFRMKMRIMVTRARYLFMCMCCIDVDDDDNVLNNAPLSSIKVDAIVAVEREQYRNRTAADDRDTAYIRVV